ncbi:MAG: flagellar basal body rod protein FlgC [Phycisphaeraceae bacterium]|nr:flagellar basal body rod protein FlgC [Phycisphaerales bacterium]QOJ18043.1 MAG: flagellar basal body rod protein FlgC [Phycisphaeraceae bacterium]
MYGSLDISTSALVAQRTRLNVISANIANREVLVNAQGQYAPYQRRIALLASGDPASGRAEGVHVADIVTDDTLLFRYEPDSRFANADGYVGYPNVDPVKEMVNAMEASRSYEANIAAIEATKSMINAALEVIA